MTITTSQLASGLATLLGLSTEDAATLATLFTDWDPTTPTDLATLVTDFVSASGVRDESYNDWWVGTATGGPASDGYYPITVFGGGTISLPSPAKMQAEMARLTFKGATATTTTLNAITGAATNDVWLVSATNRLYGRTSAGAWIDLGPAGVEGPIGLTPAVSVTITTLNPGATPTVTKTGGDEAPSFELGLPRARNARHSLSVSAAYALEAGEMLALWCAEQDTTFDVAASRAKAKVAATAATTIAIRKNGSAWGTITWAADATAATVTIASPTVAAGDLIEFVAPTPADATLAHVAITLAGAA
ncbi:hypothetical protein [Caulobacter sp. 3R27C2-B]|uniref:hypothetical protein n=1 Tax=Caulobacter sp. 3R27C2-B TaxID=2502219 RepID=UPI0010F8EE49|nr:hypothetical protein [Caulobacter sp. 3R27C2-B]